MMPGFADGHRFGIVTAGGQSVIRSFGAVLRPCDVAGCFGGFGDNALETILPLPSSRAMLRS